MNPYDFVEKKKQIKQLDISEVTHGDDLVWYVWYFYDNKDHIVRIKTCSSDDAFRLMCNKICNETKDAYEDVVNYFCGDYQCHIISNKPF